MQKGHIATILYSPHMDFISMAGMNKHGNVLTVHMGLIFINWIVLLICNNKCMVDANGIDDSFVFPKCNIQISNQDGISFHQLNLLVSLHDSKVHNIITILESPLLLYLATSFVHHCHLYPCYVLSEGESVTYPSELKHNSLVMHCLVAK